MATFIIAALTADGFIAKSDRHPANWTSRADKKFFETITKQAGVVIMGSKTYKTIGRPLKDRLNIIYSRDSCRFEGEGVEITQKPPVDLICELKGRGYQDIAICGGSEIYTMFLEAGVVDKLYLTIEGVIFGQGISLFNKSLNNYFLQLINVRSIGDNSVVLEYTIVQNK